MDWEAMILSEELREEIRQRLMDIMSWMLSKEKVFRKLWSMLLNQLLQKNILWMITNKGLRQL